MEVPWRYRGYFPARSSLFLKAALASQGLQHVYQCSGFPKACFYRRQRSTTTPSRLRTPLHWLGFGLPSGSLFLIRETPAATISRLCNAAGPERERERERETLSEVSELARQRTLSSTIGERAINHCPHSRT
ncbi:hypothetical protein L209DRAFT_86211 [Thermothelomyces heterothallicus CBS 203.75]